MTLAAMCAGVLAVWSAGAGSDDVSSATEQSLEPVLVSSMPIAAEELLNAQAASLKLTTRRIPSQFVPSDALRSIDQVIGRRAGTDLPPGTYMTSSSLAGRNAGGSRGRPQLPNGLHPVEIQVDSPATPPLGAGGSGGPGTARVDVVVTSMPQNGPDGRTYIAAGNVPLLALRPGRAGAGPSSAVLALNRGDALKLIHAESYARSIRLLMDGPSNPQQR